MRNPTTKIYSCVYKYLCMYIYKDKNTYYHSS